jgi:hypothetical protein
LIRADDLLQRLLACGAEFGSRAALDPLVNVCDLKLPKSPNFVGGHIPGGYPDVNGFFGHPEPCGIENMWLDFRHGSQINWFSPCSKAV